MSIEEYYKKLDNNYPFEGHSAQVPDQCSKLQELIATPGIGLAMEIGFNAGHSADLFLSANKFMKLISFELEGYDYVLKGKNYIDNTYPFRHRLVLGDSAASVPLFSQENFNLKFDFIFIDGDHSYEGALSDLFNCRCLAHKRSLIVMDDTRLEDELRGYNVGPTRAWRSFVKKGLIKELGSENYDALPGCPTWRGQSWGNYTLD